MRTHNIGAPNSMARYVSTANWGKNTHCVLEYVGNKVVLRAAGDEKHCQGYAKGNCRLFCVSDFQEVQNEN